MISRAALVGCICAATLSTVDALAHPRGCDGSEMIRPRRDASTRLVERQTWQDKASSTDVNAECAVYSYAPVLAMEPSYPAIWQIANLSQAGTDQTANQLYQEILPSIPNIPVKGTSDGNFSSFTPTYDHTDPDCWWSYSHCDSPKIAGIPADVTACPEPKTWGLTYDDGPNCSHNAFYDFLNERNQKATLFYIGSNLMDWPLEGQRGLAEGHEICAHTWSHRYMTALTNEQVFAELYFSKKAVKDILGVTPQCWRPPYGDVDDRVRYIAGALGMQTIMWTYDTFDWKFAVIGQAQVDANYQDIIQAGANGTYDNSGLIVLTHELNNDTMQTAEQFLPQIQSTFANVAPIAVCLNNSQPYVEGSAYTYPNFAQWAAGARNGSLAAPSASANAAISVPLGTSMTSGQSISQTFAYASNTASAGVSNAPTSGASGSSGGSSSSSGSGSKSAAGRTAPIAVAAVAVVGAAIGGALALL